MPFFISNEYIMTKRKMSTRLTRTKRIMNTKYNKCDFCTFFVLCSICDWLILPFVHYEFCTFRALCSHFPFCT